MNKVNNNLILVSGILAFIFGLFLTSPVYAQSRTGVIPFPYFPSNSYQNYSNTQNTNYYNNPNYSVAYNGQIPGCEGRNTGFSTVIQGQSCVGNYINNQYPTYQNNAYPTNNNQYYNPNTNNAPANNTSTNTTNTSSNTVSKNTKNTTVAKTTTVKNNTVATTTGTASDINENYKGLSTDKDTFSGLTANALFGSNSFMPSGIFQWIMLLIIILAIIFLWRYVHGEEKYLAEPLKHA